MLATNETFIYLCRGYKTEFILTFSDQNQDYLFQTKCVVIYSWCHSRKKIQPTEIWTYKRYLGGVLIFIIKKKSICKKKKKIYRILQSKLSEEFKICCKSIKMYKERAHLYKTNICNWDSPTWISLCDKNNG